MRIVLGVIFHPQPLLSEAMMSTFGLGFFDSDEAQDFVDKVRRVGFSCILEKSETLKTTEFIESDQAIELLAGAAILSAARNGVKWEGLSLPQKILSSIRKNFPDSELQSVRQAVERIRRNSELAALWAENPENFAVWTQNIERLLLSLEPPPTETPKVKPNGTKAVKAFSTPCIVGDLIAIPLLRDCYALGKVLFISRVFKKIVLLGMYGIKLQSASAPGSLPDGYVKLIYTTIYPIKDKTWTVVGHASPINQDASLSLRRVANEVWEGDKRLRRASKADQKNLPEMEISYSPEDHIKVILGIETRASQCYQAGLRYLEDKKYEDAIAGFSQAIISEPGHVLAYMARAKAYALSGDFTKATADEERAKTLGQDG